MKTLILILLVPVLAQAQENATCKERGHVSSGLCSSTLAYYPDQIVDLSDKTLRISWNGNSVKCRCDRCGRDFSIAPAKPETTIVWKSNNNPLLAASTDKLFVTAPSDSVQPVHPESIVYDEHQLDNNAAQSANSVFSLWGGFRAGAEYMQQFVKPYGVTIGICGEARFNLSKDLSAGFKVLLPVGMDNANFRITLDKRLF